MNQIKQVKFLLLMTCLLLSLPAWAQERQLMEISTEKLYDGSIKVLFILTEVRNPNMFYYKTPSAPKVVCDFFDVKVKPGLKQEIRVDKRYIQNVRLGEHHDPRDKVRVVLDLIPGVKYSVKEVPPEPNIFSVIIKSDEIESADSATPVDESEIDEDQQEETISTEIETSQQGTTTIPSIPETESEQNEPEDVTPESSVSQEEIKTADEGDKDQDEEKDDVFSEDNEWIEKLIDANADLKAPNKWPVQKSYGNIKLIVHLDTDPNGFIALKGYAINMSEEFLYRIQLDFDLFNENADIIEQAYAEFFNVEPGERRKLNVHVAVKTASKFLLMQQLFW
jgi:hypothetical protein